MRLTKSELDRINKYKCIFEKAQELTGVPWEAVAAVWWRESGTVAPPITPGGPFQFDPVPSDATLDRLLKSYSSCNPDERAAIVAKGVNDFAAGAILCAAFLRLKSRARLTPAATDAELADAFYGYNGRAYGAVTNSPYVYNGVRSEPLRLRGTIPDGKGGRKKIDTPDRRPGCLVILRQLRGQL